MGNDLSVIGKVTYDVKVYGTQATIIAHLPLGFKMREYTRVYNIKDATDLKMSAEEYILFQKDEMYKDLLARMNLTPKQLLR